MKCKDLPENCTVPKNAHNWVLSLALFCKRGRPIGCVSYLLLIWMIHETSTCPPVRESSGRSSHVPSGLQQAVCSGTQESSVCEPGAICSGQLLRRRRGTGWQLVGRLFGGNCPYCLDRLRGNSTGVYALQETSVLRAMLGVLGCHNFAWAQTGLVVFFLEKSDWETQKFQLFLNNYEFDFIISKTASNSWLLWIFEP